MSVLGDLVVLDRETGLVWQRNVSSSYSVSFYDAEAICHTDCTSGRYGWRLPTTEELMSLANIDPNSPDHLFPGHPFNIDVTGAGYWTSTTLIDNLAKVVYFDRMGVGYEDKMTGHRLWCVRGGHGYDGKR